MPTKNETDDDILGAIPTRKWSLGIIIVLLMIILVALVAWWLDYRSAVEVALQIFPENKWIDIHSDQDGQIEKIWIIEGQEVAENDPVILFKTAANWDDISKLLSWLEEAGEGSVPTGNYGSLSLAVNDLMAKMHQLEIKKTIGTGQQALWIRQAVDSLEQIFAHIDQQILLIQKEVEIAKDNYEEYQVLFEAGAASRLEMNDRKAAWIHFRQNLAGKLLEKKQLRGDLLIKKSQVSKLLSGKKEEIALLVLAVQTSKQQLRSQIALWRNRHEIRTPRSGVIHLPRVLEKGDYITKGAGVAKILPEENNTFQATGYLNAQRSGEVKIGDEVLLRVAAYPYRKFGQLEGRVSSVGKAFISDETGQGIPITIHLENGMMTTHHESLKFTDGMPALGRIVVE